MIAMQVHEVCNVYSVCSLNANFKIERGVKNVIVPLCRFKCLYLEGTNA